MGNGEGELVFGLEVAAEEVADHQLKIFVVVEEGVDFADDGNVDSEALGEAEGGTGGGDTFGDGGTGGEGVFEGFAAAEAFAEGPVAAESGEAGDGEVAEAAEAGEGFGAGSGGDAEAADFGLAAGDDGGFGIIAEAEAISDAGGDGDAIFEGAAEFDSEAVGTAIDAEGEGMEGGLDAFGHFEVFGSGDHGRGDGAGDFGGEAGSGEGGDGKVRVEGLEDTAHGEAGFEFDPFGGGDDGDAQAIEVLGDIADGFGGDDHDDQVGVGEGGGQVGGELPGGGEIDAGEVRLVATGTFHDLEVMRIMAPEGEGVLVFVEDETEGGTPGTGAENGDVHGVGGGGVGVGVGLGGR